MKSTQAFYASPGADDRFLRPKSGGSYAPRQIAVLSQPPYAWLSWIHYRNARDAIVTVRTDRESDGSLCVVDTAEASDKPVYFSKPALVHQHDPLSASLFFARGNNNAWHVHNHRITARTTKCIETLTTRCSSLYHLDAVGCNGGKITLAYAGTTDGAPGLQVFTRSCRNGVWENEIVHTLRGGSLNRPKLCADADGNVWMAADCYRNRRYRIVYKRVAGPDTSWTFAGIDPGKDPADGCVWELFPSIVCDAEGNIWISWLRQVPVRREDVMGLHQEADAMCLRGDRRTESERRGESIANLDLGLLPIERYFGYDGLRRYPRLLPTTDGAVWLLWEGQKDETETWDHLENGYLLARRHRNGVWSEVNILRDRGCCHCFDDKTIYDPDQVRIVYKGDHRHSGNDFRTVDLNLLDDFPRYHPRIEIPSRGCWEGWQPQVLPVSVCRDPATCPPPDGSPAGMSLYWGDLHCHSYFSPDAEGEADELCHFARDLAKLDFTAVVDNDFYPDKALLDSELAYTQSIAARLSQPDRFVALAGYEYTFHRPDRNRSFNHRIVISTREDFHVVRRNEADGNSERAFRNALQNREDLCYPHHAYWRLLSLPGEWVVEITSAWGTYILDADTVHNALLKGHTFGFIGNSDSHRFMPGLSGALTGLYAQELTKSGILNAIRERRCFATTGNRTALTFRLNDGFMGQTVDRTEKLCFRWTVVPHGRLEKVEIIGNGRMVFQSTDPSGSWITQVPPAEKKSWYYLRVKECGVQRRYPHNVAPAWGKWAWTSPIWVGSPR